MDKFISTLIDARALKSAFELGLIGFLAQHQPCPFESLQRQLGHDIQGLRLLFDLLQANRVVEEQPAGLSLTASFLAALEYRDLLEAKLDFANLVAPDFIGSFTLLLTNPAAFMRQSRIFELFNYGNALSPNPESERRTRAWMRFTTCLTRYEARACLRHHDFSPYRRMLDIGGNSGEFVLQIARASPQLEGTIFDLPVVCAVGRAHVRAEPEAGRISFIGGNALTDPLPSGFDLVTFKSMLHDWPELEARRLLTRASGSLKPGGTLLIFERGPLQTDKTAPPYSLLPMMLFFRSFRLAGVYENQLQTIGFQRITVRHFNLETPFFLVVAHLGPLSELTHPFRPAMID